MTLKAKLAILYRPWKPVAITSIDLGPPSDFVKATLSYPEAFRTVTS